MLLRDIRDKRPRIKQDDIYQLYEELLPDPLKEAFPAILMIHAPERNKDLVQCLFLKKSPAYTSLSGIRLYLEQHPEIIAALMDHCELYLTEVSSYIRYPVFAQACKKWFKTLRFSGTDPFYKELYDAIYEDPENLSIPLSYMILECFCLNSCDLSSFYQVRCEQKAKDEKFKEMVSDTISELLMKLKDEAP